MEAFTDHWCSTGSIEIFSCFFQFSEIRTIINELIENFHWNPQDGYPLRKISMIRKEEYDRLIYFSKSALSLEYSASKFEPTTI